MLPRPFDHPGRGQHLRIAVATGGNPQSSVRAGMLGLPISYAIIGGQPAQFAPLVDLYRRAHEESGHRRGRPVRLGGGHGYFAQDGKAARDYFYPYWLESMRRISSERGFPMPNRISYESQAARGGAYFVGEPEQIAERIVALHEVLHHDRQSFQMDLSGVPQAESLRSIELLGTQVAPLVREAPSPSGPIRPVSYAHIASSTRFRAPSLSIRLPRWVFTVLRLMCSSSAISELVRPRATVTSTSSSRPVSGVEGLRRRAVRGASANAASSRTRDARGDQRVAVGGRVDRLHEQLGAGVLEQEPAGARPAARRARTRPGRRS